MNTKVQLVCAWFAPAMALLLFIGFGAVAGWIPPRAANESAQQVAEMYRADQYSILAGTTIMFVAWTMRGPLVAVISYQLSRMQPQTSLFAYMQLVCGGAGWIFIDHPARQSRLATTAGCPATPTARLDEERPVVRGGESARLRVAGDAFQGELLTTPFGPTF